MDARKFTRRFWSDVTPFETGASTTAKFNHLPFRPAAPIPIEKSRSPMTNTSNAAFAEPWRQLWNGDLTQLDAIVAEGFVAHAALIAGQAKARGEAGQRSASGSAACTP